jgi:hypothetical protein
VWPTFRAETFKIEHGNVSPIGKLNVGRVFIELIAYICYGLARALRSFINVSLIYSFLSSPNQV